MGVTNAITSQFMAAIVLFGDTAWKKERYITGRKCEAWWVIIYGCRCGLISMVFTFDENRRE